MPRDDTGVLEANPRFSSRSSELHIGVHMKTEQPGMFLAAESNAHDFDLVVSSLLSCCEAVFVD